MNRRGKRLTLGVMAVGLAVLLGLAIAYRKSILEHVEAWHFQLTRKTETITRESAPPWSLHVNLGVRDLFWIVADGSSLPVIFDPLDVKSKGNTRLWTVGKLGCADVLQDLREDGYRVLEQRFPRRAYVIIRDQSATP